MATILNESLDSLVQAVGDPFECPDLPLHYKQPGEAGNYEPMMIVVILIEFASSTVWRNHLHRSNFISCEKLLDTENGRRNALSCMMKTAADRLWKKFLDTPVKICAAVERLEELECLKTAEAVILWAWTTGVVKEGDCQGWRLIGRITSKFYRMDEDGVYGRLATLRRHLTDNDETMERDHRKFLLRKTISEFPPCRVKRLRKFVIVNDEMKEEHVGDLRISQVCQAIKLNQCATWRE